MRKAYILDTNVLIHCPDALFKFSDNDVYICPQVIEELDRHKYDNGEAGFNTREALRNIKELLVGHTDLNNIPILDQGRLFLDDSSATYQTTTSLDLDDSIPDNRIIRFAHRIAARKQEQTILVTNDTGMMIKARRYGIETQEFRSDRVADVSSIYTGRGMLPVTDLRLERFFKNGWMKTSEPFAPNQFVRITGASGGTALSQYRQGRLEALRYLEEKPYDITARNEGQRYLMESLLSPQEETPLVLVNGPAGTGKTLLALACGLEQVTEKHIYKRVLVCRPNAIMDNDIGYLPGSEEEKISPLLRGIYDNLEILLGSKEDNPLELKGKIDEIFQRGYIRAEAVGFLRGRSITNTFIIIDEAQNTSPTQILSIITRAGEGSKIVILGDINQIDLPRLDKGNNGLTYAITKMQDSQLCDIISFKESECTRSPLAKEAADRLKL